MNMHCNNIIIQTNYTKIANKHTHYTGIFQHLPY